MPNWIENIMTVKNKPEYLDIILDKDKKVNFSLAVPMPQELQDTEESSEIPKQVYCYLSDKGTKSLEETISNPWNRMTFEKCTPQSYLTKDVNERMKQAAACVEKLAEDKRKEYYDTGKKIAENVEKYGARSWYDWANNHWGCKWNASETLVGYKDNDTVVIWFETPWSPPTEWLKTLGTEKKVPFKLIWRDEDGSGGQIISDGNKVF